VKSNTIFTFLGASVVVTAIVLTSLAPGAASAPGLVPAPQAVQKALFADLMRAEPALRQASQRAFPGDRWSADDDFHNHERELVNQLARTYGLSEAAAWDALDEGLHAGWPGADTPGVLHTAPPCHPRPFD